MKTEFQKYILDLQTEATEMVDALLASKGAPPIPLAFEADSTFRILVHAIDASEQHLEQVRASEIPAGSSYINLSIADGIKLLYEAREEVRAML